MKAIFFFFGFILITSFNSNRIGLLCLDKVLAEAKQIKTIIVISYAESTMQYRNAAGGSTENITCRYRRGSEKYRSDLINSGQMLSSLKAGSWPQEGDTVLMVVNENDRVEVFAQKMNVMYRFWDPNYGPINNSIFTFPSKPPYYRLPICSQKSFNRINSLNCNDGCLVDADSVKMK